MNIDNLKSLSEKLIQEVNNITEFAKKTEADSLVSNEFDVKLREREKKLDGRESQLKGREDEVKANNELLGKKLVEIEQKESIISKLDDLREQIRKDREELDAKRAENDKKVEELAKKIKDYDFLVEKEKEIEHREALMAKETLLDRSRKEDLDIWEESLKKEASRLQKIASGMSIMGIKDNSVV